MTEILFGGSLDVLGEAPTKEIEAAKLSGEPAFTAADLLVASGLSPSKGQARKDIEGGGAYLNNVRLEAFGRPVTPADLLFGKHLLVRKGKRNYAVVTAK